MTENVEGQETTEQEQPSVTPAPVSEQEDKQLSQQGSQDVVSRSEFEELKALYQESIKEQRGLQQAHDKTLSTFEQTMKELNVELSPEQRTELRLKQLEDKLAVPAQQPLVSVPEQVIVDSAEVTPPQEAPPPAGASIVTPGGGGSPSSANADVLVAERDKILETRESVTDPEKRKRLKEIGQELADIES